MSLTFSATWPNSIEATHVQTGYYGASTAGPLATHGLMGCLAVIVHDPDAHRGALGHMEPARDIEQVLGTLLAAAGIGTTDRGRVQIAFIGGAREQAFAETVSAALVAHGLTAMNVFDGRRLQNPPPDPKWPQIGEPIQGGEGGRAVSYSPATGQVQVTNNPLVLPSYKQHGAMVRALP
ncbi:MAG: hypothetical protein ABW321_19230 [Polyangiales bacterium]